MYCYSNENYNVDIWSVERTYSPLLFQAVILKTNHYL